MNNISRSIFPTVSGILSLRDYLAFLSVCVLVNLVLPFSGLVHKVLYIRNALSVLVFILIGVLSFSFFASELGKIPNHGMAESRPCPSAPRLGRH